MKSQMLLLVIDIPVNNQVLATSRWALGAKAISEQQPASGCGRGD